MASYKNQILGVTCARTFSSGKKATILIKTKATTLSLGLADVSLL